MSATLMAENSTPFIGVWVELVAPCTPLLSMVLPLFSFTLKMVMLPLFEVSIVDAVVIGFAESAKAGAAMEDIAIVAAMLTAAR